jgi:hypothetical protein
VYQLVRRPFGPLALGLLVIACENKLDFTQSCEHGISIGFGKFCAFVEVVSAALFVYIASDDFVEF